MSEIEGSRVSYVVIEEGSEGQRLDNFLIKKIKGAPKSFIYRIIRKGEVRVNKKRAKQTTRLALGDSVRIPPVVMKASPDKPSSLQKLAAIRDCIIFEDDYMLAMNKPAGLPVHGGTGLSGGLIELLRAARPDLRYIELVHRLDKGTSGCLLLAKKRSILRELHSILREHGMKKHYLALTQGHWASGALKVNVPLEKFHRVSGERVVKVGPEGKEAKTHFKVLKTFDKASLMEVRLLTGRTHQIRVHAQYQQHSVAGDEKYGDKVFNQYCRGFGLKRMFLHAARLAFYLSSQEREVKLEAPLDEKLTRVIQRLEDE